MNSLDYPTPIVDLKISTLKAKKYIYDIRATQKAKIESKKAYIKHGSRRKKERTKEEKNK